MATALGLDLPIRRGSNGFFTQTFDTRGVVRNNLRTLMLTRRGEVPMNPEFGTDLFSNLFEHNNDEIEDVVRQKILDEVERWMSYVTILQVSFDRSNDVIDVNQLRIIIKYTTKFDQTPDQIALEI